MTHARRDLFGEDTKKTSYYTQPAGSTASHFMGILPLRAAVKRGALLVVANWPIVLIGFTAESLYKAAVSIPVLGASLGLATLVGADTTALLSQGVRATADVILASLATAPLALTLFLLALAVVGIGGEAIMFVVKAGTLAIVVEADRASGDVHRIPFGTEALQRARVYRLESLLLASRRFSRRAVRLALWLGAGYAFVGLTYVAVVSLGLSSVERSPWLPAWPLVVLAATSIGIVTIAIVNLTYDLVRVVVVTDDCEIGVAVSRLKQFVIEDARQVIGIFSVIGAVQILAAVGSLLAATGLALVTYVPFASLVLVPLQAAAWVLRGLVFESMALSALAACQTQYRRFSEERWPMDERSVRAAPRPVISPRGA
ncbi:MAG: hypothetical protein ABI051_10805 [Vicinamibacterales bacterium]